MYLRTDPYLNGAPGGREEGATTLGPPGHQGATWDSFQQLDRVLETPCDLILARFLVCMYCVPRYLGAYLGKLSV